MATCQICGGKAKGFLTEVCDSCRPAPTPRIELPTPAPIAPKDQPRSSNAWLLKIIGFVVGFAIVAALEYGVLMAIHGIPRGAAWIVLPIIAGSALASAAPGLVDRFSSSGVTLWRTDARMRLVGALSAVWLVAVPAYWWLFEPYDGYKMYGDDFALMFKVMFFPVIVLVAGYFAYVKIVVPPGRSSDDS